MSIADLRSVCLILDTDFGQALDEVSARMPVWIANSPANDAAVKRLWDTASEMSRNGVTTFPMSEEETAASGCERIVLDLDQHHNRFSCKVPYARLIVIGTYLQDVSLDTFVMCHFTSFFCTPSGFNAEKLDPYAVDP